MAARAGDRERLARLAQARDRCGADPLEVDEPSVDEDAELVAAEPVGRAAAGDAPAQPFAEPVEQRVAGGVAERVVVGLEAVEVEQQQEPPRRVPAVEEGLQALHQRASVAETGQLVGERLDPRCSEHRQVLVEGQCHARDHGSQPE